MLILSLSDEFFAMLLPQSIHHAKSQSHCVIIDNGAPPIRMRDADRLNLQSMPLRIFDNSRRGVKAHGLIVQQTRIKFGRAMHF